MWTWWVWWWWWWCSFFFFFFLNVNAAVSRSCALLINDLPWWWLSDVSLICPNMEIGLNTKRQMITSSLHAVETNIFFGLVMEQIHKRETESWVKFTFFFFWKAEHTQERSGVQYWFHLDSQVSNGLFVLIMKSIYTSICQNIVNLLIKI